MLIITRRVERTHGEDFTRCKAYQIDSFTKIECWGCEIIAERKNGTNQLLGNYISNERAVGVFDEIVALYSKYYHTKGGPLLSQEGYVQPLYFEPPKIYTMPEN